MVPHINNGRLPMRQHIRSLTREQSDRIAKLEALWEGVGCDTDTLEYNLLQDAWAAIHDTQCLVDLAEKDLRGE